MTKYYALILNKSSITVAMIIVGFAALMAGGCGNDQSVASNDTSTTAAISPSQPAPLGAPDDSNGGGGNVAMDGSSFVAGPAPDITLKSLDGKSYNLSKLKGHPVMVDMWATWCGPCKLGLPFTQRAYQELKKRGLIVLTATSDPKSAVESFMKTNKYTFPVMMDSDNALAASFQVSGIPTTIFIDSKGMVVDKEVGLFPQTNTINSLKKTGLDTSGFEPKNDPTLQ